MGTSFRTVAGMVQIAKSASTASSAPVRVSRQDDAGPVRGLADLGDDAPVPDEGAHALLERPGDGVHAPGRLHQRRVGVEELAVVELVFPEIGLEQLAEVQGVVHLPGLDARVDAFAPVSAAAGSLVEMIRVQVAEATEHGEDALLVLARERAVQGVAVHRLGEQLGDVPAQIGRDPAARNGLAAETLPVVEQGRAVVVGEDLQIDPELLAVAEGSSGGGRGCGPAPCSRTGDPRRRSPPVAGRRSPPARPRRGR